jgi:hypothetical protein
MKAAASKGCITGGQEVQCNDVPFYSAGDGSHVKATMGVMLGQQWV